MSEFRFEVALSFAGDNKRDKIREISELLRSQLGEGKVFFDEWYEAEIARIDAHHYLQELYRKHSKLVVMCVCSRYAEKDYTRWERRAIEDFEINLPEEQRCRFLPIRFDEVELAGVFSSAIVPDVRDRSAQQIADLLLERLSLVNVALSKPQTVDVKRLLSWDEVRDRLRQELLSNLGKRTDAFGPTIDLANSFPRTVEADIQAWWNDPSAKSLALLGKEGMGKSWAAARWLRGFSGPELTLWFAGREVDTDDILALVGRKLRDHFPDAPDWAERLQVERPPMLVVFDGINRISPECGRSILRQAHGWIRFLFSCRPHDWDNLVAGLSAPNTLSVVEFDDREFKDALSSCELRLADVPDNLVELLRIPLYFKVGMALRSRLGELRRVSKEALYYFAIEERLESDPELRDRLGLQAGTKDLLGLIRELSDKARTSLSRSEMVVHLKNYTSEALKALEELCSSGLVLTDAVGDFSLEEKVLCHGLGLVLLRSLVPKKHTVLTECIDYIEQFLEPSSETDTSGAILSAALFYSQLQGSSQTDRLSLLIVWTRSHNFGPGKGHEEFSAQFFQDPELNLALAEHVWKDRYSDRNLKKLLSKLLLEWLRQSPDWPTALELSARKWLAYAQMPKVGYYSQFKLRDGLDFPSFCRRYSLVVADTPSQTNLYHLALMLFSVKPISTLLPYLARGVVAGTVMGRSSSSELSWLMQAVADTKVANELVDLKAEAEGEMVSAYERLCERIVQIDRGLVGSVYLRGRGVYGGLHDGGISDFLKAPDGLRNVFGYLNEAALNPFLGQLPVELQAELNSYLDQKWLSGHTIASQLWTDRSTTEAEWEYDNVSAYLCSCQPDLWKRIIRKQFQGWCASPTAFCWDLAGFSGLLTDEDLEMGWSAIAILCQQQGNSATHFGAIQDLVSILLARMDSGRHLELLRLLPPLAVGPTFALQLEQLDTPEFEDLVLAEFDRDYPAGFDKWLSILYGLNKFRRNEILQRALRVLHEQPLTGIGLCLVDRLEPTVEQRRQLYENRPEWGGCWWGNLGEGWGSAFPDSYLELQNGVPLDLLGCWITPETSQDRVEEYVLLLDEALADTARSPGGPQVVQAVRHLPTAVPSRPSHLQVSVEAPNSYDSRAFGSLLGEPESASTHLFQDPPEKDPARGQLVASLEENRNLGNQLFGDFSRPLALGGLAYHRLGYLKKLCDSALDIPPEAVHRANSFYSVLTLTLLDHDPERGLRLLGHLRKLGRFSESVDEFSAPLHLRKVFAVGASQALVEHRESLLTSANEDDHLLQIAMSARRGDWIWLQQWAMDRLGHSRALERSRACRLLGWAPSSEFVKPLLLRVLKGDQSHWTRAVALSALRSLDEELWARHWYEKAKFSLDETTATAATHMFLKVADYRALLWTHYSDIEELEPPRRQLFVWMWQRFRGHLLNHKRQQRDVFLGHQLSHLRDRVWPWLPDLDSSWGGAQSRFLD